MLFIVVAAKRKKIRNMWLTKCVVVVINLVLNTKTITQALCSLICHDS